MSKILFLLLAFGVIALVGCTAVTESSTDNLKKSSSSEIESEEQVEKSNEKEASDTKSSTIRTKTDGEIKTLKDGTKYIINPNQLLAGGPPKDGIPSLDNPTFTSVDEADWLDDNDLVLGLNYNGAVKAYPHRILNWHEIVNDRAGDKAVLITYCPLCRTGIAFEPVIDGEEVEFGTSGKLFNSELVMYDRKTDSYWSQSPGKAIIGPLTGTVLKKVPLDTVQWKDWKKVHPDSLVLSKKTGFIRNYDSNPYTGFQSSGTVGFGVDFEDKRLHPKAIVFGAELDGKTKAYSEDSVKEEKLINDIVGQTSIAVIWDNELNTVKIFETTLEGETLSFELKNNEITDNKNNKWTVADMEEKLERVDTFGHFWFAWAAFYPDTELHNA